MRLKICHLASVFTFKRLKIDRKHCQSLSCLRIVTNNIEIGVGGVHTLVDLSYMQPYPDVRH